MEAPRHDTHVPFLDHIRGFAILIVFLFHCLMATPGFDPMLWNGWFADFTQMRWPSLLVFPAALGGVGVPIFFVVSGFCIHLSHSRTRQKSIRHFFIRRFFRIYPPYLAALLIFSFVFPWHSIRFNSLFNFAQFGSHVLLVHNFSERSFFAINASFWSIAVEFQLYLLYPLLLTLVGRFSWLKALWLLAALEIAMRLFGGVYETVYNAAPPRWIDGSPLGYWFSWSIGAAAAEAFLQHRSLPFSWAPVWLFPLLTLASTLVRPLVPFSFVFAALATVSAISHLLGKNPGLENATSHRGSEYLRQVGVLSYSIYLLHQPIVILVPRYIEKLMPGLDLHPLATFVLCLGTWIPVLLCSRLFYRFIELPSIALGKIVLRWSPMPGKVAIAAPVSGAERSE